MRRYPCPYLGGDVEFTDEREGHVVADHPEMATELPCIATTLADPDAVRTSSRFADARVISRWFDDLRRAKHLVVVVASEPSRNRRWIMTAYVARKLSGGNIEWSRS